MTPKPKIHITADVPVDLLEKVDERVEQLGFNRSFAIRQGLALFLYAYRQERMEILNPNDDFPIIQMRENNPTTTDSAGSVEARNG